MIMVETAPYEVIKKIGEVEIRNYPEIILATIIDAGEENSFNLLLNYISGNNKGSSKISMTTPVITPEKIEMTTPVINKDKTMSFVLPSKYSIENTPEPNDKRVQVYAQPSKKMAVIKFSGYTNDENIRKNTDTLLSVLETEGIKTIGEPLLMRYNAPWTPGFLRKNEVAIELN